MDELIDSLKQTKAQLASRLADSEKGRSINKFFIFPDRSKKADSIADLADKLASADILHRDERNKLEEKVSESQTLLENEKALRCKAEELQKSAEEQTFRIEQDLVKAQERYRETLLELGREHAY